MWWSPWSRDVAYMTSHSSVIRSGRLTTLSKDRSSIGLSILPPPSPPRLFIQGWEINEQLGTRVSGYNWVNMCAERKPQSVLLGHTGLLCSHWAQVWRARRGSLLWLYGLECRLSSLLLRASKRESTAEAAPKAFFRITLRLKKRVGRGGTEKERKKCTLFKTIYIFYLISTQ